jgi:SAM-dependent methyltransferase
VLEFTGERVIPGEVEPDLWNEHVSRYRFAARLAASKVVADLGCGAGYGAAILAESAAFVHGFDLSQEAVAWASDRYRAENLRFAAAGCSAVPLDDAEAGLVVAFELIEHLADADALLSEARRILAPEGLFCVSTPNAAYYAASRGDKGPNPFHVREYTLAEFRDTLTAHFPFVAMFTQNHTPAISFQALDQNLPAGAEIEGQVSESAHFFVAICSVQPSEDLAPFVYVPTSGNVLRERETHIARLEEELRRKQHWLDESLSEHSTLVKAHHRLTEDLEAANEWARKLDATIAEQSAETVRLSGELETANEWAKSRDAEFTEKAAHVESLLEEVAGLKSVAAEVDSRTRWALDLQQELDAKSADLVHALDLLHAAEEDRDRRTEWALALDAERRALLEQLKAASESRWLRLGRAFHLGPNLAP